MSEREAANKIEKGGRRYREQIHRESRYADTHKNLPFKFSKPVKNKPTNMYVICEKCSKSMFVSEDTITVICKCGYVSRIKSLKCKGSIQ